MFTFSLYGSNEVLNTDSSSLVNLASVTALTDLVSVGASAYKLGYKNIRDGENTTGGSDVMINSGYSRRAYEIRTQGFHWVNDIETIDNLENTLSKRFVYLDLAPSFDLYTTLLTANKVIACAENGEWERENQGPNRIFSIYLANKKRNQ